MPALEVYHEILPESFLLILGENSEMPEEVALATVLRQAARSGKSSVWVDCARVHRLSTQALSLLSAYYTQLQARQRPLVLCHLDADLQAAVAQLPVAARPPMVANLAEAGRYCHCAA